MLESRLVAAIDHPSIVPIYDSGEEDGVLYIAMRYVDGGDLGELIRASRRAATPRRALAILEQLAAALDAVHARGLVHRDVKPANILVDESGGRAFLGDFGIAAPPARGRSAMRPALRRARSGTRRPSSSTASPRGRPPTSTRSAACCTSA